MDETPGRRCYCGRPGCIETFLSGPGMAADHAAMGIGAGIGAGGGALSAKDIVSRALGGDLDCTGTLERYEERLARALASVINIIDPEVIVLGGGLSNVKRWYETVPVLWEPFVFSDVIRTRLVPNVHGDSSGVRGAAWLWNPAEICTS